MAAGEKSNGLKDAERLECGSVLPLSESAGQPAALQALARGSNGPNAAGWDSPPYQQRVPWLGALSKDAVPHV